MLISFRRFFVCDRKDPTPKSSKTKPVETAKEDKNYDPKSEEKEILLPEPNRQINPTPIKEVLDDHSSHLKVSSNVNGVFSLPERHILLSVKSKVAVFYS